MPRRSPRIRIALAWAMLGAAASACAIQTSHLAASPDAGTGGGPQAGLVAASLAELGLPDDKVLEIDTSGIVAKHSSKFSGTVAAPPGIIAKNSSKYRIQAYAEIPVEGIHVYLTTLDERLFASGGRRAVVKTDREGKFDFGSFVLPPRTDVVVHARPPEGPRELVAYTVSAEGENVLDIGLASTVTTRFLLDVANRHGKPPSAFSSARLAAIRDKTKAMLKREDLIISPADLEEGGEPRLRRAYFDAMASKEPTLLQSWRDLLGAELERPAAEGSEQSQPIPPKTFTGI